MDDILVFGHSVTAGYWDPEGGWVQRLNSFLDSRALETGDEEDVFYMYNLGVSGDTTEDILERMEDEFRRRTEEEYETLLLIQIGVNDSVEDSKTGELELDPESFRQSFEELLRKAEQLADSLVVVGDFPVSPELDQIPYSPDRKLELERLKRYERVKKDICGKRGISYIDLFSLVDTGKVDEFLVEGVHPNSRGHELIYKKVREALESLELV